MAWDKKINIVIFSFVLTILLSCNRNQYAKYHAYVGDLMDTTPLSIDTSGYKVKHSDILNLFSDTAFSHFSYKSIDSIPAYDKKIEPDFAIDSMLLLEENVADNIDTINYETNQAFLINDSATINYSDEKFIDNVKNERQKTKKQIDTLFQTRPDTILLTNGELKQENANNATLLTDTIYHNSGESSVNQLNKITINHVDTVILNIGKIQFNLPDSNYIDSNYVKKPINSTLDTIKKESISTNLTFNGDTTKQGITFIKDTVYLPGELKAVNDSTKSDSISSERLTIKINAISDSISQDSIIYKNPVIKTNIDTSDIEQANSTSNVSEKTTPDLLEKDMSQENNKIANSYKNINPAPANKELPVDSIVSVIYNKIKHELNGEIDYMITQKIDSLVNNKLPTNSITNNPKPVYQFSDTIYYKINQISIAAPIPEVSESNKDCIILLSSYTDALGDESYNLLLSEKRAEYFKKLLIQKGYKESNLFIQYFGEKYSTGNHNLDRKLVVKFICIE
jgi:hypothetical protein